MPPHEVPFFNILSISIPQTLGYQIRVKLELFKFDGNEKQCIAWINNAKEHFDIHNIPYNSKKIKYAAMQLEGNAYNWYMWWKTTTQVCSFNWNKFKNDILNRFQGVIVVRDYAPNKRRSGITNILKHLQTIDFWSTE